MGIILESLSIITSLFIFKFLDFFFIEGFIKPQIAKLGNKYINKYLPILFSRLDKKIPDFIISGKDDELKELVINEIKKVSLQLTNEKVINDKSINEVYKHFINSYNPINASKRFKN